MKHALKFVALLLCALSVNAQVIEQRAPFKNAVATVAVSTTVTLPNPTSTQQNVYVTGTAGTVLTAVTTTITMPATPLDGGTIIVGFDSAQVPSWSPNTGQSFPTGSPSQVLMQPGSAIRFYYDGAGLRGAAGSWYWDALTSADGGLYSSAGEYQASTLAGHVQTLEGQVIALLGTAGNVSVTGGVGTATFDTGANIPKLDGVNVFTTSQRISDAEPRFLFNESDQGADAKLWDIDVSGGTMCFRTRTDADGVSLSNFCMTRGGSTTAIGAITATGLVPSSASLGFGANARINLPGSAQLGFVTNTTQAGYVDTDQTLQWLAHMRIDSTEPRFLLNETDQATDAKLWDLDLSGGNLCFRTRTDADGATGITPMCLGRSGGLTSVGGVTGTGFVPTSAATIGNRINLPGTNQLGFVTNGTQAGFFDSDQSLHLSKNVFTVGAVPIISVTSGTCTAGTATGGPGAGIFTITAGSASPCTFSLIFGNTATTGYRCLANDETSATFMAQSGHTTTSCTMRLATSTTNDVVIYGPVYEF